jgi:integrase
MPEKIKPLAAITVSRLSKEGLHRVDDGLYLKIGKIPTAKSWILRTQALEGQRKYGLGAYPKVTLSEARKVAEKLREDLENGKDPTIERRAKRAKLLENRAKTVTFDLCAARYIEAKRPEWSSPKHAAQWTSTLARYASPYIGKLPVKDIKRAQVLELLNLIWLTKTETASRLRGRIEAVLDYAKSLDLRTGDNPAAWRGGLQAVLAAPKKVTPVVNQPALSYTRISEFMANVRAAQGMGAKCLEFAVLTAVRSNEAAGATWAEIDLDAALWTIPAQRMKKKKAHFVPLSTQAVALLQSLPTFVGNPHVFASPSKQGAGVVGDTLLVLAKRIAKGMGETVTTHGFRTTMNEWAANCTDFDSQTVQFALAHKLSDSVEAAYQRSTLLAKRKPLMQAWANRCYDNNPPHVFDK